MDDKITSLLNSVVELSTKATEVHHYILGQSLIAKYSNDACYRVYKGEGLLSDINTEISRLTERMSNYLAEVDAKREETAEANKGEHI